MFEKSGLIFRTFTVMDNDMFLNLYKSVVRPHLEYASSIWSPREGKKRIARPGLEPRTSRIPCELSDHWASEPHGRPVTFISWVPTWRCLHFFWNGSSFSIFSPSLQHYLNWFVHLCLVYLSWFCHRASHHRQTVSYMTELLLGGHL